MRRIPRVVALLLFSGALAISGLAAQVSSPTTGNTDAKVFAIDLGATFGYGLSGNSPTVGRTFGINFTVADSLAVGFVDTQVGATPVDYKLARLSYALNPSLGFNLYVGSDTNTAGGAGVYYNILKSKSDTAFSTALKLRLEYLFDVSNGIAKGDLLLAVSPSIGI
jgi:hypothetical protein